MRALLAFAAAVAVFHHVPSAGGPFGVAVDLVTPFAVVGAAALVLVGLGTGPAAGVVALAAGVAYVDGHGLHLSANAIRAEGLAGDAERVAVFWDEHASHVEWHLGLLGLLAAFCLAERSAPRPVESALAPVAAASALLGLTLFTSTVEGQTWWLLPPAAALLGVWWAVARRPVLGACGGGAVLAGLLLAAWAAWHGGVPEFSDLGWI